MKTIQFQLYNSINSLFIAFLFMIFFPKEALVSKLFYDTYTFKQISRAIGNNSCGQKHRTVSENGTTHYLKKALLFHGLFIDLKYLKLFIRVHQA